MRYVLDGSPSFAHVHVDLEPGESIVGEAAAMASMDADVGMKAMFNGGFLSALLRRFLGKESLFVNVFTNAASAPRRVTLTSVSPGEMRAMELNGGEICLEPGAFVAATPGLNLGVRWAGIRFFLAREGLFKLKVSGTGTLFFGAYGGMVDKTVNGELIVDSAHLVAFEPQLKLGMRMAGGLFSSLAGGEGLVLRVMGQGKVVLQTRTLPAFAGWLNPKLALRRAAGGVISRMTGGR